MKKYFLLMVIALLWGGQFVFMSQAVGGMSPSWVAVGRSVCGAITLGLLCSLLRIKGSGFNWRVYMTLGFVNAALPFVLLAWAQQYVASVVSSIIMGMIPLMTLLLAPLLIATERLTKKNILSVGLGFIGILILFGPELMAVDAKVPLLPLLAILVGAGCYALGMLLVKRLATEAPLLVARNTLIAGTAQLFLVCLIQGESLPSSVSINAMGGLLMLGIFSTGIGYYAFMSLIAHSGPAFAALSNYLVPLVGFVMGAWILGEKLLATTGWALLMILLAVAINQWDFSSSWRRLKKR